MTYTFKYEIGQRVNVKGMGAATILWLVIDKRNIQEYYVTYDNVGPGYMNGAIAEKYITGLAID